MKTKINQIPLKIFLFRSRHHGDQHVLLPLPDGESPRDPGEVPGGAQGHLWGGHGEGRHLRGPRQHEVSRDVSQGESPAVSECSHLFEVNITTCFRKIVFIYLQSHW